jgi:hypothetical protein
MLNLVVDEDVTYVGYLAIVRFHCNLFVLCAAAPSVATFEPRYRFSGNLARALGNILRPSFRGTFAKL